MSRFTSVRRRFGAVVRVAADRGGAAAVEFAFIAPVLFLLTLGMIELGMILFEYHRMGEAARSGARVALIEDPIPKLIDLSSLPDITCNGADGGSVTCTGATVANSSSFTDVLAAMQNILPTLKGSNVAIIYIDSDITDATELTGLVTPILTLKIEGYQYSYFFLDTLPGIPATMTLPEFSTTRVVHTVKLSN
jgi:hypothetical protein